MFPPINLIEIPEVPDLLLDRLPFPGISPARSLRRVTRASRNGGMARLITHMVTFILNNKDN